MKLLTILMLLSSSVFSQTFTTRYMAIREITVDSAVTTATKVYKMPTVIHVEPRRVQISNPMVNLDLYGEAFLTKKILIYRNKFGELFVIKRSRKSLLIISDKEYILTSKLK